MPETRAPLDHKADAATIARLSDREFELLTLTLNVSYSDARERLNSAERIADGAIRGLLLLNGAGVGTIVTLLGLRAGSFGIKLIHHPTFFALAVLFMIAGVGAAATAAATYTLATYKRSDFELAVAENLLHQFMPSIAGGLDEERPLKTFDRLWRRTQWAVALSFAAFACGSALALAAVIYTGSNVGPEHILGFL